MNISKKMMILILLVFSISLLTGCGDQTKLNEVIRIGYIGPLTGESSSLGVPNLRGIEIAIDTLNGAGGINGKQIQLISEDDQLDDRLALTAFQKLTSVDNVDAILTTNYGASLSIATLADQQKVVVLESVDTSEELASAGDYLFPTGIYDEGIGYAIGGYIEKIRPGEPIAVMFFEEEPFMTLVKDAIKTRVTGNVLFEEGYTLSERDFRTRLGKIQAAGVKTIAVLGYDEVGMILRQARELGIDATFFGIDTMTSENFRKNADGADEGAYATFWEAPATAAAEQFVVNYEKKYGQKPENILFSVVGHDSMMILADALRRADTAGISLRDAMYSVKNVDGISGKLTIDEDGALRSVQESMYQIRNGKMEKV